MSSWKSAITAAIAAATVFLVSACESIRAARFHMGGLVVTRCDGMCLERHPGRCTGYGRMGSERRPPTASMMNARMSASRSQRS